MEMIKALINLPSFLKKGSLTTHDGIILRDFNGLVQDCSNAIALAMELLQSCTKPSIWTNSSNELLNLVS